MTASLIVLAFVALVCVIVWRSSRVPRRPEPDEHTTLMDDPGLALRCRTGSGFGDFNPSPERNVL